MGTKAKVKLTFLLVGGLLSPFTVIGESHGPNSQTSINLDGRRADTAKASNQFGVELYKHLRKENPGMENLMISPLSAFMALSMLYNGASGETKLAIAEVLAIYQVDLDDLNHANKLLLNLLAADREGVKLEVANAIVADSRFTLKPDFIKRVNAAYNALIEAKDFKDKETVNYINEWVREKTHEKIKSIVSELDPSDRAILLNATYFKGKWSVPFEKYLTRESQFNKGDGTQVVTQMMSQADSFKHIDDSEYEAVELPYGRNGSASMVILLPKKGIKLESFERGLSADKIAAIANQLHENSYQYGTVKIPKWKQENSVALNDTLSQMGMKVAFGAEADFSKLSGEQLQVGKALQKSFISVDEGGTEAAAVTAISVGTSSIGPQPKYDFEADRPFIYTIRDNESEAILFIGSVTDPN